MNDRQAAEDLELVRQILDATRRRLDPQMFHFVIWGGIVVVWYPLDNWLTAEKAGWQGTVAVMSLALGTILSVIGGVVANRRPRLPAADPDFAARILKFCSAFIGTGILCSLMLVTVIDAPQWLPHLWGFVYALSLMVLGAFYSRECFWFGLLALGGTIAAAWQREFAGYILGITMGPAALVSGLIAESRVRRMKHEAVNVGDG
jgi:hypothetical protein